MGWSSIAGLARLDEKTLHFRMTLDDQMGGTLRDKCFTDMVPESHLKLLAKTVLRANAYPASYGGPGGGLVGKSRKSRNNSEAVRASHEESKGAFVEPK